jgi:NADH-quinone oxidoreductase subunit N
LTGEIILVLVAFAALVLDLVLARREVTVTARMRMIGRVAGFGLIAAMAALVLGWDQEPVALLGGTLVTDRLTTVFKFVIAGLSFLTVLISIRYDVGRHVGEYYAMLLFGTIGMMLLVSAEELIMIFVALELTSISLYVLTAFHKASLRSQEAAMKYFMFGGISSAFLLFGLSYVYGLTGVTALDDLNKVICQPGAIRMSPLLAAGLLFIIVGFGFKVAVVPFHLWAPDAYEGAPTPVTALIATGSKVASFFVLLKLMMISFGGVAGSAFWGHFSSGWTMLLAIVATASMVLGNFAAIAQRNVKRLLAYSSIAHAGYILVGLVAATKMGATSVLFYLIVYALANLGAFGVIAALVPQSGNAGGEDMADFNGMARRAPFLSLLMLVFLLSLAGIPPLGGFFGKFYLFAAAVQRDPQQFGLLWLVIIGILTSAMSLYYYLIVLKHFYVEKPANASRIETPVYLNVTLALVAAGVIALGLFPQPLLALLDNLIGNL